MSQYWDDKRKTYEQSDWSKRPSIFAEFAGTYFPENSEILELGAGLGQDSIYFAEKGHQVESTDLVVDLSQTFPNGVVRKQLDMNQPLPYAAESVDVVYAHLALHYFDSKTTARIFDEIYRVLKPGGVIAFLVNSVNDPEYNTGNKIEDDYFETDGTKKRYFTRKTAAEFGAKFNILVCDEEGETYKDNAKGVHGLVRFIGKRRD